MREERFDDFNSLSFLKLIKSEGVGLGVKKYIYRVIGSAYRLELLTYKGDDFYSYNPELIKIIKYDFGTNSVVSPKQIEATIEDVILEMPEDNRKEALFNINLFV